MVNDNRLYFANNLVFLSQSQGAGPKPVPYSQLTPDKLAGLTIQFNVSIDINHVFLRFNS